MLERLILLALLQTADLTTADQLFNTGRFAEAEAQYRRLVQKMPNEPALLWRLGACDYQLGNFAAAEKEFRKALVGLGTSLVALGRSDAALPFLERGVKLAPSNRMARRALGHAYVEQQEFLQGEPILRRLVEEDPRDGESWFYLGTLLFNRHYDDAALSALEESLKINPANVEAQIDRASALAQLGRNQQADAAFQRLARDPKLQGSPEFRLAYAQFLFQNERYDDALIKVEAAIKAAPKAAKLHFWKARILFHLDKTDLAIPEAEQAVALAPELPNARNLLL